MAGLDYAGLLTGISPQSAKIDPFSLPTAGQQRMAFGAQQAQGLQRAGEGLFKLKSGSPQEIAKTEMYKLDRADPQYEQKFIKLLSIADPARAAEVQQKAVQQGLDKEAKEVEQKRFDLTRKDKEREFKISERRVAATEAELKAQGFKTTKVEIYDPVQKKNVVQWVLTSDPTVVIREELAAVDPVKEYAGMQKIINDSSTFARKADNKERQALKVARLLESADPSAGLVGTIEERIKALGGTQDDASMARTLAEGLIAGEAIASLPQGPATDTDIEIARRGQPPANASAEYLASYARGLAKLARKESQYYRDQNAWYSLHNTPKGFLASQTIKKSKETLEGFKTPTQVEMLKKVRESYGEPNEQDTRMAFEKEFGFDLKNLDQDYDLAKQVVEKVTGGA
jgi:hypothetical protein